MYENITTKLSYKILEFIAKNKYLSKTLAIYLFPDYSQSHVEKTLKKLFDDKLLLRKMIENEPIRSGREYVYYLSKKGAQKVLSISNKFAEVEEMNIGSGNVNFICHDLCVSWIAAMWKKQSHEYNIIFDEIAIETRRNFLRCGEVIPDLKIVTKKADKTLSYYIEVDNLTVQSKEWQKRCSYYENLIKDDAYLLVILTRFNQKRLSKLINISSSRNIVPSNFLGTSLQDIYYFGYIANIWTNQNEYEGLYLSI